MIAAGPLQRCVGLKLLVHSTDSTNYYTYTQTMKEDNGGSEMERWNTAEERYIEG